MVTAAAGPPTDARERILATSYDLFL
ncbi:MAG: hypothetical protein JWM61_613, partial [Micrococcaceae bacterium]|nr:hypothetical protein [Micrococcaceae bacterium]